MAGVKGRSGGRRVGAGGKPGPKPAPLQAVNGQAPLEFLLSVQNDPEVDPRLRVRAAVAAAQYVHTRRHDGGKKDQVARDAKQAAKGRFSPSAPPLKLVTKA